jgi:hypothetical protein
MWWLSVALAVPLSAAPQRVRGPSTAFGQSALAIGDLTGDGLAEVVLGVADTQAGGQPVGQVELWRGGATLQPLASISGSASMLGLGQAIAIGDVSCDGVPDLIVSAAGGPPPWGEGAVLAWFGPLAGASLSLTNADINLTGDDPYDGIGRSLAVGQDLTGDGCGDLVIGAPYVDAAGQLDAGAVYVVAGGGRRSGRVGAASAATIRGGAFYGQLGYAVAVGEFDGDDVADLVIGEFGTAFGAAWTVAGNALSPGLVADVASVGAAYSLPVGGGSVGASVGAMDLDGDGLSELVVGAPTVGGPPVPGGAVCVASPGSIAAGGVWDLRDWGGCAQGPSGSMLFGSAVTAVAGLRGPGSRDLVSMGFVSVGSGLQSARPTLWDLSGGLPTPGVPWAPSGPGIDPIPGVATMLLGVAAGPDVDGDGRADLAVSVFQASTGRVWVTLW